MIKKYVYRVIMDTINKACFGFLFSAFLLCLLGCSKRGDGFAYEPVSGVVTLDGNPAVNVTVAFSPQGTSLESGRPSIGITDTKGWYVAKTLDGVDGAAIGEHLISITAEQLDPDTHEVIQPETIPARYNDRSELRLTVPSGGTQKADFSLQSN